MPRAILVMLAMMAVSPAQVTFGGDAGSAGAGSAKANGRSETDRPPNAPAAAVRPKPTTAVCILPFTSAAGITNLGDADLAAAYLSEICVQMGRFHVTTRTNLELAGHCFRGQVLRNQFSLTTRGSVLSLLWPEQFREEGIPFERLDIQSTKQVATIDCEFHLVFEDRQGRQLASRLGSYRQHTNSFSLAVDLGVIRIGRTPADERADASYVKSLAIKMALFNALTNILPQIDAALAAAAEPPASGKPNDLSRIAWFSIVVVLALVVFGTVWKYAGNGLRKRRISERSRSADSGTPAQARSHPARKEVETESTSG